MIKEGGLKKRIIKRTIKEGEGKGRGCLMKCMNEEECPKKSGFKGKDDIRGG